MPEERSKSTRALPDVQEAAKWAGNVASTAVEYITPRTDQSEEFKTQVAALFHEFDIDRSGALDKQELQGALKKLGLPFSMDYVDVLMSQFDKNGDGQVDSHEFSAYIAGQEDKIFSAFQELDADHTGEVDDHELLMALKKLGHNIKPDDADRMIKLLDKDGNGQIDLDEFRRFVVLLPQNQLSGGGIITNWIDSADWATGIEYRLSMTPPQQWRDRLIAGGVAGAVSRTTVAPLERLRTMMMADPANISLPGTIRKMWADGGVRGLFKGNLATVTKVIPQCAIQMSVYDYVKDKLQAKHPDDKLNNVERLTAGVAAGAASTISTYPMENLRTHVSLGRKGGYLKILNDIYCSRGLVSGVYGGFGPCMVNTVTTTGLGFLSYEIGCDLYRKYGMEKPRAPTPGERGFIAGGGAIAVMAATMPLEVQGSPGHPVKYKSMADCFAVMAREEGLGSFWRGTVSSWMKVVPSIAIVRFMYEVMNSFQGSSGIRGYRTSPPNKASQQATAS